MAALLAMLAGCGGARMIGPSENPSPSSSDTPTVAQTQGVLCDSNGGPAEMPRCALAGTTSTVGTLTFRAARTGTIRISAITRALGFEEYPLFRLVCAGRDNHLTARSGRRVPPSAWFTLVPGMTSAIGAADIVYAADAPVSANASCVLTFAFDLAPESLPYTPYDLTISPE